MTGLDDARLKMLIRPGEIGTKQADLFPPTSKAGQAFAALPPLVSKLTSYDAAVRSGRLAERGTLTSRAVAYEALRDDLSDIRRTADAIDLDIPGVADRFKLPARTSSPICRKTSTGSMR